MIDLDAWLKAMNPVDGTKWTLNGAYALTDSGLVTGYGTHYDADGLSFGQQSFLLDASSLVPEPSTIALLGIGAIGILWLRRNSSLNRKTDRQFSP